MTAPTINVNLTPCDCGGADPVLGHAPDCPGAPVLLPCPLPRTVEFQVRLGECDCGNVVGNGVRMPRHHAPSCPAAPMRVTCTIGGDGTLAGSEVTGIVVGVEAHRDGPAVLAVCRERWALVRALMLGLPVEDDDGRWTGSAISLFSQRAAVFSKLADMARAENEHQRSTSALVEALKAADPEREHVTDAAGSYAMLCLDGRPNAEAGLHSYLTILLEQVEAMT